MIARNSLKLKLITSIYIQSFHLTVEKIKNRKCVSV